MSKRVVKNQWESRVHTRTHWTAQRMFMCAAAHARYLLILAVIRVIRFCFALPPCRNIKMWKISYNRLHNKLFVEFEFLPRLCTFAALSFHPFAAAKTLLDFQFYASVEMAFYVIFSCCCCCRWIRNCFFCISTCMCAFVIWLT